MKTWDDIKVFDDIIDSREVEINLELEKDSKRKCPHLSKEGNFFYYCSKGIEQPVDKSIGPFSPVYQRHAGAMVLSMYCLKDFETCCFYRGDLKR